MTIKNMSTRVAAAAAFAFAAQAAFAQPGPSPSRAEVKAATGAAVRAGTLTPAGEGPGTMGSSLAGTAPGAAPGKPRAVDNAAGKSRSEVTREARAATGTRATAAGQHALPQNAPDAPTAASTRTRAERKAEARAANRAGQIRNGEAPRPLSEPQKK